MEQSDRAERGEDVALMELWFARTWIVIAAAFIAVIGLCLWQSWNNFWTVTEWSQVQ